MIDSRELPSKQPSPKLVTVEGMVIEVREVQPEKQLSPRLVTDDGITVVLIPKIILFVAVSIIALQLSRESNTGLPKATVTVSSEVQASKQRTPMLVNDAGMVIDGSDVQFEKQRSPKLVTDSGMVIGLRE